MLVPAQATEQPCRILWSSRIEVVYYHATGSVVSVEVFLAKPRINHRISKATCLSPALATASATGQAMLLDEVSSPALEDGDAAIL
jgi:hypothetical protein